LVTFTVGGNDIGYIATAFDCGEHGAGCSVNQTKLNSELAALKVSLATVVETIRAKALSAKIVLVSYPRLVPPTTYPALNFTPRGAQLVGTMGQDLEQVFLEIAHQTHVLLADPYAQGETHGPYAPKAERWIAGHTTVGFPYHPTPLGQMVMAAPTEQDLRQQ
jgi:hypothetical protein